MPTKVPKPDKTPESISPTLWNGENREEILAFLGDLNAAGDAAEIEKQFEVKEDENQAKED